MGLITVITGPPCSGKTTYARQHAKPGDLIIDFDEIAQALGSPSTHEHPPHIREVTAAAWAQAIRRAIELRKPAWIIDSRPKPDRMERYRAARATIVPLSATADILHQRATDAGRPVIVHKQIDEWFTRPRTAQPTSRIRW